MLTDAAKQHIREEVKRLRALADELERSLVLNGVAERDAAHHEEAAAPAARKKPGRRPMTATQRKAHSLRMKKIWAEKRKAGKG